MWSVVVVAARLPSHFSCLLLPASLCSLSPSSSSSSFSSAPQPPASYLRPPRLLSPSSSCPRPPLVRSSSFALHTLLLLIVLVLCSTSLSSFLPLLVLPLVVVLLLFNRRGLLLVLVLLVLVLVLVLSAASRMTSSQLFLAPTANWPANQLTHDYQPAVNGTRQRARGCAMLCADCMHVSLSRPTAYVACAALFVARLLFWLRVGRLHFRRVPTLFVFYAPCAGAGLMSSARLQRATASWSSVVAGAT